MTEPNNDEDTRDSETDHSKYSPADFEVPEPEQNDGLVICAGCGESAPVSEMGATADNTMLHDGAVLEITRKYVHNDEECLLGAIEDA